MRLVLFVFLAATLWLHAGVAAKAQDDTLLKRFDTNGDGKISDAERQAVREKLRQIRAKPGAMTPSGKTESVGSREVTEMQYASTDGRKIPCVLSMPKGDGPFPVLVTIHGGQGDRDFGYLRTMAAPNRLSPTIAALNEQPWAILAISYRAGNGALFGMEQDDVIAGIRYAKTLPKIDPARVGVIGGSHGGHLALVAAETMGREFLCFAVGSPWMTDPVVYMTGDPKQPPLSLVPEKARDETVKNGRRLFQGLTIGRGMSERQAKEFIAQHSIEANAGKIVVPSLFITSRGDEQAPHVLVEPTIERIRAAGRDVTVYTADKSPHGFYWARTISAARALRGGKSKQEENEERTARETIIAFFRKQFARTDVKVTSSPKETAAPAVTPPYASQEPTVAGAAGMTREQFRQRLAAARGSLADRPGLADRLFDRLDGDKDGVLSADEFARLRALRSGRAGAPESGPPSDTRKEPTAGQVEAIRKLRSRLADMPVPRGLQRRTLVVGGKEREFFIHIPEQCRGKASPVMFALHGGATSTGLAMHVKTDFTVLGDKEGYVTVYPSGVNGWNIGSHDAYSVKRRTSDADDIGFFRAMFDALIAEKIADPKRIYVVGGSNGGVMTQFLVCHLADRIAGAGVVVATLPRAAERDWPKPSRRVPILVMLGTVDPMKPWAGNRDQMSADETIAYWRKHNACATASQRWDLPDRDPDDGCRVTAERWEGKAPVLFYTLKGHGHGWPMQKGRDTTGTGPKTRDISAPEELWAFFQSVAKPTPTQLTETP